VRSRIIATISAATLTIGGLAGILVGTTGIAGAAPVVDTSPTATSQPYTIGSGAVSSPTATPSSTTTGASGVEYTVSFITPVALTPGTDTIDVNDPSGKTGFPLVPADYTIVNPGGSYIQGATAPAVTTLSTAATLTAPPSGITLSIAAPTVSGTTIAAGSTVEVIITGVVNPSTAGVYSLQIWTSQDPVAATTASYSIAGAAASTCVGLAATAAPTAPAYAAVTGGHPTGTTAASSTALAGATGVTYCLPGTATAGAAIGTTETITFTGGTLPATASDYSVNGTAVGTTGFVDTSATSVTIELPVALIAAGAYDVGITGVTSPGAGPLIPVVENQSGGATFHFGTAPASLSVVASPSTGGVVSTWTVTLKATTAIPAGDSLTLFAPSGTTFPINPSQYLFNDNVTTSGNGPLGSTADLSVLNSTAAQSATTFSEVTFITPVLIGTTDTVTLTVIGVTNPVAGVYSNAGTTGYFALTSDTDTTKAAAASTTIGVPTSTSSLYVSVTPPTPSAAGATYKIASFQVDSSGIAAGGSFEVSAPAGTILPNLATDYAIGDITHPASAGVPTSVTYETTTADVLITVPTAVAAGDILSLTIMGVTNPGAGVYTLELGGVQGLTTLAAAPNAAVTGATWSFTKSTTGAVFIWAGGKAFPITSVANYDAVVAAIPKADRATVVTGVTVTPAQITGTSRPGTLLQVVGKATIWVVGTTGNVYSFNSPSNLLTDGYNPGNVVPVESLAGLIPASGFAPTAAVTWADDSLLSGSKGGIYLIEGGTAFPVTTPTELASIQQWDKAKIIAGTVTAAQTNQAPASGTLFQAIGTKGVYVSYQGVLYTIVSPTILLADGYTWAMVKGVPSVSTLPIAVVSS